ncbi:MAG: sn-glycerol-1-phosphate dehydrogenase [Anaerolineae bacterium]
MPAVSSYQDLLGATIDCACGRRHSVPIRAVCIESGALARTPEIAQQVGPGRTGLLVADRHTYAAAGRVVQERLEQAGYTLRLCLLEGEPTVRPDEATLMRVLVEYRPGATDFLLAVGSGSINDTVRFVSHKVGVPYMVVATAPSMDGYASTVSPLLVGGFKRTYPATYPSAILADTDVLCAAPDEMVSAGFGDLVGKAISLADWRLGAAIQGETVCPLAMELMEQAMARVLADAEGIRARRSDSIVALTEALVLSGIAMLLQGDSRPASGCEHHVAHYLEMRYLMLGREPLLHGLKVGLGTRCMARLYDRLRGVEVDSIDVARLVAVRPSRDAWMDGVRRAFGPLAEEVIAENGEDDWQTGAVEARLMRIRAAWQEAIQPALASVPSLNQIDAWSAQAGADFSPAGLRVEPALVREAVVHAKEIRTRYTALRLAADLGLLTEDLAAELTAGL